MSSGGAQRGSGHSVCTLDHFWHGCLWEVPASVPVNRWDHIHTCIYIYIYIYVCVYILYAYVYVCEHASANLPLTAAAYGGVVDWDLCMMLTASLFLSMQLVNESFQCNSSIPMPIIIKLKNLKCKDKK